MTCDNLILDINIQLKFNLVCKPISHKGEVKKLNKETKIMIDREINSKYLWLNTIHYYYYYLKLQLTKDD